MSGNNEDDKPDGNKGSFPLDLASKLTASKAVDISKGPSVVMTQPLRGMRVLTQSAISAVGTAATGSSISIVPQTMIKTDALQRSQIASIITNPSQTPTVTIARPTHITLTTSVSQPGTTYHVPRGPAVVANLATPRSAVASPIRAPGLATTPPSQPTSFVTAVRQVAPSRTPSPGTIPTAWLSTSGAMQVQGGVKGATVLSPTLRVPVSGAPVRGPQVVARGPAIAQARPTVMHTGLTAAQTTTGIQSVTIAQVLPTRTQALVYTPGNNQHFAGSPRLALTGISTTQRPVTLARPNQVARLAVPVSVSQGATRLTVTPGQGAIYTSGARISAVQAPTQNTVVGTTVRAGVPINQPARLAVSSPGTLLTNTQTRFTVPNQNPQPTVVIGTQAGRLSASVVSLHPVVVANNPQGARNIQAQGPKVIQQAQGQSIQLAQVPTVAKLPTQQNTVVPVAVTVATPSTRTINVSPAAIVSQRPVVAVSSSQSIPIAKVLNPGQRATIEAVDVPSSVHQNATNVYIHAPVVRRSSPGPTNSIITESQRPPVTTSVATYSLPGGTTYYYDTSYTVPANLVARPFTPGTTGSFATVPQNTVQIRTTSIPQVQGIMSGQPIQFSPIMVVDQKRGQQYVEGSVVQQSPNPDHQINPLPSIGKVTSSPRPSILRKRDNEGSPLKAAKNLAPVLANLSAPISPPSRPESRGNCGQSSGGSTTISATSSPGLDDAGDNSQPLPPVSISSTVAATVIKLEQDDDRPPQEMSPRKKPRKQQLTGNDLHEPKFNIDDMQFLSENKIKKEELEECETPTREQPPEIRSDVTVKKPAPASLLNSYRQTWKSTHNHYLRYTDVKPKDERRPSVIDLANQSHVSQKINGWKIYHLSTQMEDLADLETQVYEKLSSMLKLMETKECSGNGKEFNRINELIKGNMQRSKIINDGMIDAKGQVMKIFDHKEHVADIINRCASKRNFKKRDKF